MANWRPVNTDIWTDSKVKKQMTLNDKVAFLYLLTNTRTQQLGIYVIPLDVMALESGLSLDDVEISIKKLEDLGIIKYSYDKEEVAIINYLKYSIVSGGATQDSCYNNIEKKVKDMSLLFPVYESLRKVLDPRPTFKYALGNIEKCVKSMEEKGSNTHILPLIIPEEAYNLYVANESKSNDNEVINNNKTANSTISTPLQKRTEEKEQDGIKFINGIRYVLGVDGNWYDEPEDYEDSPFGY